MDGQDEHLQLAECTERYQISAILPPQILSRNPRSDPAPPLRRPPRREDSSLMTRGADKCRLNEMQSIRRLDCTRIIIFVPVVINPRYSVRSNDRFLCNAG
jgi:hypothetical protein